MKSDKRVPLYMQLRAYISDQIQQQVLKPHDKLPTEQELSEQFKVSRITVKNALKDLAEEGVIYRIQGRGTFVSGAEKKETALYEGTQTSASLPVVAVIVPRLDNLFIGNVLIGLESRLARYQYRMLFMTTQDHQDLERKVLQEMAADGVKGLIIYPAEGENYNEEILKLSLHNFPIVLIDRYLPGINTNFVGTDNFQAAYDAVTYLIARGHSEIGFVSSEVKGTTSLEERFEGYRQALLQHGLPLNYDYQLFQADEDEISRFLAARQGRFAVLAAHNGIGHRVMKAAAELDIAIPERLSVIFFDDYEYSDLTRVKPALIVQDAEQIGLQAVELLMKAINGQESKAQLKLATRFQEGDSVLDLHTPTRGESR
ncbi:GntR family transcriptional regulator [Paenibacillus athensensis]|uniref:GntR family transcriptional regulator n=1 Tax=Paenibacillus athensensis TaxID=1967502 RepID=UPI001ADD9B4E|nr:GntR family transcriptional regulator [Paenibacillus athensensis]MCD1261183.1 GntR family transcriptional regulator [Paenibacillus athensensis]